jgi:hypothetical protein
VVEPANGVRPGVCISDRSTRVAVGDRANPANSRTPDAVLGGHDPIQRLPTAVPTTVNTRNFGSCP